MPVEQYAWLLALAMIAARRGSAPDQEDPSKLLVEDVSGIAGRLKPTQGSAANDLVAALFISYLLFALLRAKRRAKTLRIGPDFCKFNDAAIFSDIPAIPHQMAAAGFRALTQVSAKSITSHRRP